METINLINFLGASMLGIISYFLKRTMDELKDVKQIASENKSKILVLENDYINKYSHLTEKFDILCESVRDLTSEIKELNKELNKKKDI